MKKYIITILALLSVENCIIGASHERSKAFDAYMQQEKTIDRKRSDAFKALLSTVLLGAASGYLCAKLYPTLGKPIENGLADIISKTYWNNMSEKWISDLYWKSGQKDIALLIYWILWGMCERTFLHHLITQFKKLEMDPHEQLLPYSWWASSWITYLGMLHT